MNFPPHPLELCDRKGKEKNEYDAKKLQKKFQPLPLFSQRKALSTSIYTL